MKPLVRLVCSIAFAVVLASSSSFAGVIDFNTLTGANGDPFSTYTENGFTVTASSGSWFKAFVYGNPVPDIFLGPVGSPSPGTITVTEGGGLFSFTSVDFSSNNGDTVFHITGSLGGITQFTDTGTEANGCPSCHFTTLTSTSSLKIDTLTIALTPGGGTTSFNVDNIAYSSGVVPEPGSLLLFGSGVLGLAGILRRKMSL